MNDRRVVITGLGSISPLGADTAQLWQALCDGECGIDTIKAFDPVGFTCKLAGQVGEFDRWSKRVGALPDCNGELPVATFAVGSAGAKNAAFFAAQIVAAQRPDVAEALVKARQAGVEGVEAADAKIQTDFDQKGTTP